MYISSILQLLEQAQCSNEAAGRQRSSAATPLPNVRNEVSSACNLNRGGSRTLMASEILASGRPGSARPVEPKSVGKLSAKGEGRSAPSSREVRNDRRDLPSCFEIRQRLSSPLIRSTRTGRGDRCQQYEQGALGEQPVIQPTEKADVKPGVVRCRKREEPKL
jgi:hypothetical protein